MPDTGRLTMASPPQGGAAPPASVTGADAIYAFEGFRLSPGRCLLTYRDRPVTIGSRAIGILATMVERPCELIGKEELLAAVWPEIHVHESNIKVNVSGLRRALRAVSGRDDFIKTIPGRGYLFTASVTRSEAPAPAKVGAPPAAPGEPPIFGRERDLERVHRSVAAQRATTIVGAGGVGKTTVARAAASAMGRSFPDGVHYADLSKVHDGDFVGAVVAAAVGIAEIGRNVLDDIAASLAERRALLVLDNCEHVLAAAATAVDHLLSGTRHLTVLSTSREPLRCRGETVLRLEPLPVPNPDACASPEAALAYASTQMLIARAFPDGSGVDDADIPALARIAARLNGLPLAIELAAAAASRLGLQQVEAMLSRRLDLLHDLTGSAPRRHVTLGAALEWSYGLLSPTAAAVLRAISLFRGEFGLCAAVHVVAGRGLEAIQVADRLHELCAKSLVHQRYHDGRMRYRLLDSTRAFGLDLLEVHGERAQVSNRHASYMLRLLAEAEEASRTGRGSYANLAEWVHDVRAALAWAFGPAEDAVLAVRLAVGAVPLWIELSSPAECHETSERALARLDTIPEPDQGMRARLLLGMAIARAYLPGDAGLHRRTWELTLQAARSTDDVDLLAQVLSGYARSETIAGRHTDAFRHINELRAISPLLKDGWATAEGDMLLAMGLVYTAEYAKALPLFERLTERSGTAQAPFRRGSQMVAPRLQLAITFANALWLTGAPGRADVVTEAAARAALDTGHPLARCHALTMGTITIALRNGRSDRASRYAAELADAVARHGLTAMQPVSRCLRALAAFAAGETVRPEDFLAAADALASLPASRVRPVYLVMIADALATGGCFADAGLPISAAWSRIEGSQREDWLVPELLRVRAVIAGGIGDRAAAENLLSQSLDMANGAGALGWSLRSALGLARLLRDVDREREAAAVLSPALGRVRDGAGTRDFEEASALLAQLTSGDPGARPRG